MDKYRWIVCASIIICFIYAIKCGVSAAHCIFHRDIHWEFRKIMTMPRQWGGHLGGNLLNYMFVNNLQPSIRLDDKL